MNIKIRTKGMHCKSCEIILKEAIEELNGVNAVKASHDNGAVSVDFDKSKINENIIKKTIEKEGYEVIE
jgi:copper chaperone